jgi:uncharacterized protein YxjI
MSTALVGWGRKFVAKKAIFRILGNAFRLYGPEGNLQFYVKQKAFRLKEDIGVFTDEGQRDKALSIKARSILDLGATYDVTDVKTGETVGALKRNALKSMVRDEWSILGDGDAVVGKVQEDSVLFALLRRFLAHAWFPQTFSIECGGAVAGTIKQRFNPFQLAYDVDLGEAVDPRLGVAAVVLLLAIEGRQG